MRRVRLIGWVEAAFLGLIPALAMAHSERQIESPVRPGPIPEITRVNPKRLVVCKPSAKPTAAQLEVIENRIATETGNNLAKAQAEKAAWERNELRIGNDCWEQEAPCVAGSNGSVRCKFPEAACPAPPTP